jgi:indole-3-glycerol phosphate synthase
MAGAAEDALDREAERPLADVLRAAAAAAPPLDAHAALERDERRVKIIAEVKRASPSRGTLAEIPDPAELAASYEYGGASAVSVLTEGRRFAGSLADLESVRDAVRVPVLRKDFLSNRYQVAEARAAGADLILLIVAALDDPTLIDLFAAATDLGMAVLVETHDEREVDRALNVGAQLVGVNARDLRTFEMDQDLFGRLAEGIPASVTRVAESAVKTAADVAHYRQAGADVVLVGEALVTSDPVKTLAEFLRSDS